MWFTAELVLAEIWQSVVFSGAPETGQSFGPIGSVSVQLYICCLDWLYPCNRSIRVFSHVTLLFSLLPGSLHSLCALFVIFAFLFHKCQMVSLAVWTLSLSTLPLYSLGPFHTARCPCQSSPASLPVISIFLTFEASQRCWDILFNPLKTVANLHFFENMGLIKYQDVGVGLDLLTTLSDCDSFDVVHSVFPWLLSSLLSPMPPCTSTNSLWCVHTFMKISFIFSNMEVFHVEDVFSLHSAVHLNKQLSVSSFLYVFVGSSWHDNLLY